MSSMVVLAADVAAGIAALDPPAVGLGSGVGADYLALRGLVEQLRVVELRWLAAVDGCGLAAEDGSASTTAWVRRHTGCSGRTASAEVRLARRLYSDPVRPLTTTARLLDEGALTVEHAAVIARATATLNPGAFAVTEPVVAKAAAGLGVDAAGQVAAQVCDRAQVLDAAGAEDPAAARRAAADAGRRLRLAPVGEMWALDATLTAEAGRVLAAVFAPLAVLRPGPGGEPDERSAAMRRADAMGEAAAMLLGADTLPTHGGLRPNLTVHVDLDTLLGSGSGDGGNGAGGARESAGAGGWLQRPGPVRGGDRTDRLRRPHQLGHHPHRRRAPPRRRLLGRQGKRDERDIRSRTEMVRAALRHISPALGGLPTEILDLGRTQRLVTPAQRKALTLRDRGCTWPGCDRPPNWCDAHHLTFWSHGGRSDLPYLALMCARHHTFVHHGWQLTRQPDGTVSVKPPPGAG